MSETLIPTMRFRWVTPNAAAYVEGVRRLQQCFLRPSGTEVWRDIPVVFETEAEKPREIA